MKKILAIAITVLMVVGLTANVYGVQTASKTTTATVNIGNIFSLSLDPVGDTVRSTIAFSFKTVDGSAPNGWYYNSLATLNASGDPGDNKSDVVLRSKSNVTGGYKIAIKQSNSAYATAIGYYVKNAYDGSLPATPPPSPMDPSPVIPGADFKSTSAWGTLGTADTVILNTSSIAYATFGIVMPVNFALVPSGLGQGSGTTTITYTMTSNL